MNINQAEKKKGKWEVVIFGVLFTFAQVTILSFLPARNSGISFIFNIAGAYVLRSFFWPKYIGNKVAYSRRSVVMPAIIGTVVCILMLLITLLPSLMK